MARLNLGLVTFLSLFAVVPAAHAASIADCGNIDVQASATCEVKTGVECKAQCTPLSCSASLYAECSGQCNVTPPSCDVSCSGTCEGQCSGSASFDCAANCKGTCGGSCESKCTAHCQSDANSAQCNADCNTSCTATCQGECDASCNGNATVDCSGKCQASCTGSCNASAHVDCQATCQANGSASCQGGCELACDRTDGGGLFCDGKYVDDGGHLKSCVDALKAALNITVTGYASSSGNCSGNTCTGEAKAGGSASCAMARLGSHKGAVGGLVLLGTALLGAGVRRRRQ
jgi:hypothetical protein